MAGDSRQGSLPSFLLVLLALCASWLLLVGFARYDEAAVGLASSGTAYEKIIKCAPL